MKKIKEIIKNEQGEIKTSIKVGLGVIIGSGLTIAVSKMMPRDSNCFFYALKSEDYLDVVNSLKSKN